MARSSIPSNRRSAASSKGTASGALLFSSAGFTVPSTGFCTARSLMTNSPGSCFQENHVSMPNHCAARSIKRKPQSAPVVGCMHIAWISRASAAYGLPPHRSKKSVAPFVSSSTNSAIAPFMASFSRSSGGGTTDRFSGFSPICAA